MQLFSIGEVCKVQRGTSITQTIARHGSIPVIAGGITPTYYHDTANRDGNVITISASGANAGFVNFWIPPIFASDCSTVESTRPDVSIKYVYHYLCSQQGYINSKLRSGAAQPHVYAKDIAKLVLPLPPFPEQIRIAAILDQTDAMRVKRREALARLDSLTQAIFIEMFSDGDHPIAMLENMCELITDGTHQTPVYADDGVIFLSAKNVTSGYIDWQNIKYIPKSLHLELHRRLSPKMGDILLAKNGTTGVAAIVDRDCTFDIYVSLALLRPKQGVLPTYLLGAINSPICKRQFNGALKGIGVPNLHLKEIRATKIPFPSMKQQEQFSERIKAMEKVKAAQLSSFIALDNLFASLQHRAFQGEL